MLIFRSDSQLNYHFSSVLCSWAHVEFPVHLHRNRASCKNKTFCAGLTSLCIEVDSGTLQNANQM